MHYQRLGLNTYRAYPSYGYALLIFFSGANMCKLKKYQTMLLQAAGESHLSYKEEHALLPMKLGDAIAFKNI
ncbi:putative membrane protein [Brucella sp. 10RB9215]|nr:putative membrane protein [Brucella sp. 10RB9215]